MHAKLLTPILNVSDIQQSFAWFEKLGWKKAWDWGSPPDFGCVCSGECEIFLSQDSQGGRGKVTLTATFGSLENEQGDKGVWLCIMVDDVEAVHQHCLNCKRWFGGAPQSLDFLRMGLEFKKFRMKSAKQQKL